MQRRMQQSCCGRCSWLMSAVPHQFKNSGSKSRSGPSKILSVQRHTDISRHAPLPGNVLAAAVSGVCGWSAIH